MSEYAFNPISGKLDRIGNGGSGGGGITTINGDTGSVTGTNVTVFTNNSTILSGATAKFINSGTVSTLRLSDDSLNTLLGVNCGNPTVSGSENTGYGSTCMQNLSSGTLNTAYGSRTLRDITSGFSNTAFGLAALQSCTSGNSNCAFGESALQNNYGQGNSSFGFQSIIGIGPGEYNATFGLAAGRDISSGNYNTYLGYASGIKTNIGVANIGIGSIALANLTTGSYNIAFGENSGGALTSSESSNILLSNAGVIGESNTARIGTTGTGNNQVSSMHIAAITGVTVSASAPVAIDANEQMSSLGFGTALQVLTSNGAGVSPTWQPSSVSTVSTVTSVTGSYSVLTTDEVIYVNSASPCTITLPATAGIVSGQSFVVKDISFDASTNNIIIIVSGGVVLIDNQTSQIISNDSGSFTVRMFNSQYYLE